MIVIVTLYPIGRYSGVTLPVSTLIALAVCLIPTTIGALLSAIGIAGMDRVTRFNVIAMSGKAVEACGDVDTMILDKTGTITYGNRMAADFIPVSGVSVEELTKYAALSSLSDATPEGKSVVALAKERGVVVDESNLKGAEFIEFTAKTRMSGVDLPTAPPSARAPATPLWSTSRAWAAPCPPICRATPTRCPSRAAPPSPSAWASVCWVSST